MFGHKPEKDKSSGASMVARSVQVVEWGEDFTVQENNVMYDFIARKGMFGPKVKIVQWGGKYRVKFVS